MRIASFNLENLGRRFSDAAFFRERLDVLAPQVRRLDADVLCLQEVDGVKPAGGGPRTLEAARALLEAAGAGHYAVIGSGKAETGDPSEQHNLVVASRLPVLGHHQLWNDLVPPLRHRFLFGAAAEGEDRRIGFDRPLLHVEVALPDGRRLHVVNLHLKAPLAAPVPGGKGAGGAWAHTAAWAEGFYVAAAKRAGQALEARLLVDRILDGDAGALVALAGDLNAEENETPLRILAAAVEDTGADRLAGRRLELLDGRVPEGRRFTVIHRGRRTMLDHLLASPALAACARSFEIHNEELQDETLSTPGDGNPVSFHAPVVATFAI